MKNLPDRLCRKAVRKCFTKVNEPTWNYLFRHEKENGLRAIRAKDEHERAYYRTIDLMKWLIKEAYYTPAEFDDTPQPGNRWNGLSVRTHALAA